MLEIDHLKAWYGQAQALYGVSLQVKEGELVVIQGLNGAGKSTLLKAVMGLVASQGAVRFNGQPIHHCAPHERAQSGLGYVPEDRRLFNLLSVQENLSIAASGSRAEQQHQLEWVLTLFPALAQMRSRMAHQMSGGEQQMLALARTLMTRPRLLLLDEPCEGIAPVLVDRMTQALVTLKQRGQTLLIAEQNQRLANQADRIVRLVAGQWSPTDCTA